MVKVSKSKNDTDFITTKAATNNLKQAFKAQKTMPAINMMDRFMETISQANDSGNFDGSFEIKHILSPNVSGNNLLRQRCITELDREKIEQFVRDFQQRQINNNINLVQQDNNNNNSNKIPTNQIGLKSTPKSSPYLYRKAKAIYQNSWIGSRSSSPRSQTPEPTGDVLQRNSAPERSSLRSAAKMLQFFGNKKTKSANDEEDDSDSLNSSNSSSSSSSSQHSSPETSFEMHPPMLPTFKVTPPADARGKSIGRNAASEFARFLRGSFHAKRAAIMTLRRSISDTVHYDNIDFTKAPADLEYKNTVNNKLKTSHSTSSSVYSSQSSISSPKAAVKSKALMHILADTTNQPSKPKQQQREMKPKANSMRVSHF